MRFFRIEAESRSESSALSYRKALDSLQMFFNSNASQEEFPSEKTVSDWFVNMYLRGLTVKTILLYFDLVSGLYSSAVKAGMAKPTDVFKDFKAKLKNARADEWRQAVDETLFMRFANLTRTADRHTGNTSIAVDLMLGSIQKGVASFGSVAQTRTADAHVGNETWQGIVKRHSDPRRKYVFPLNQSVRTPNQLGRDASEIVGAALDSRGIRIIGTPFETLASYWTFAALRCGASGSEILSVLGHAPKGWPVLSVCQPDNLSDAQKRKLIETVAALFTVNPRRWYAMKLRPRADFEALTHKLDMEKDHVAVPEIFYPCDEIKKRIGGKKGAKKITVQKPVLPDIVFFKTKVTDIFPLFSKIGDLAWCYTTGGRPGSGTYAVINKKEFENFQRVIAHFTSDYEVGSVGSIKLNEGDRIVVMGGDFAGREGEIIADKCSEPGVVYRVRLFDQKYDIEWRVRDARLIEKARETVKV